jgi:hypothetical protein
MSQNRQTPLLYTLTEGSTLTISGARSISILSDGGTTNVVNASNQTMTLPDGVTIDMNADGGNTLSNIVVTTAATAYITVLGGVGVLS